MQTTLSYEDSQNQLAQKVILLVETLQKGAQRQDFRHGNIILRGYWVRDIIRIDVLGLKTEIRS